MRFWGLLFLLGAGWGLTQPFSKIAVSGGYRDFGLVFWQTAIGTVLLAVILLIRGKQITWGRAQVQLAIMIALIGTVVPNATSYVAYVHLDSGIMSILISMVPIFALPMALLFGNEQWRILRLLGLLFGLAGVLMLILPGQEAIGDVSFWYVAIALIAPMLYAFEGNYVARFGTAGLDPFEVLFGASVFGMVFSGPVALASGAWINPLPPYGLPDLALVISSVIHVFVYSGYVWLVRAAGAVFAVQVSYVVTLSGIFWAQIILGEAYTGWVWGALVLVLAGVFLVQPKPGLQLAPDPEDGQT